MGADRTAPVVLGPVTWVYLARHADAQASEEATVALKNQYLDAILPVYAVSTHFCRFSIQYVCLHVVVPGSGEVKSRRVASCTSAVAFVVELVVEDSFLDKSILWREHELRRPELELFLAQRFVDKRRCHGVLTA